MQAFMGNVNLISKHQRWLRHVSNLVYWVMVWIFFDLFFGYGKLFDLYSLSFSLIVVLITAGVSYFMTRSLIPRFLYTRKYGRFILYTFYTLIVSLYLELMAVFVFFIWVQNFSLLLLDGSSRDIYSLIAGTYFIVLLSVAIEMIRFAFDAQNRRQRALRENIETELKLLKSQIHPHFLFNTLNNIYALAIQKSDRVSDAVLKLSGLLDYLLYHGEQEEVELRKELELISDYIELEKLRYGKRLKVQYSVEGEQDNIMISPVLFLPLVENAFKHGVSRSRGEVWLSIDIGISGTGIDFRAENSKPAFREIPEDKQGIGLENLKKRLALLYHGRYGLEIHDLNETYSVRLSIQFK